MCAKLAKEECANIWDGQRKGIREGSQPGRENRLYQVKEEERIEMCLGIILLHVEQKMERSVKINHEGPQMPG